MIDENIKNHIIDKLQKMLEDWRKEKKFEKPRNKWTRLGEGTWGPINFVFCLMVGPDKFEIAHMVDELSSVQNKFIPKPKETDERFAEDGTIY